MARQPNRQGPALTERAVVHELQAHPDGLAANILVEKFGGFAKRDVQRVIHSALDKGTIEVGARMNLYPAKAAR